jgi:hypothetical protein
VTDARVVLPQDPRRRINTPACTPKGETGGKRRLKPVRPQVDLLGPSESEDRDSSRRPFKASRDSTRSIFQPRLPEGGQGFRIEGLETRGPFARSAPSAHPEGGSNIAGPSSGPRKLLITWHCRQCRRPKAANSDSATALRAPLRKQSPPCARSTALRRTQSREHEALFETSE